MSLCRVITANTSATKNRLVYNLDALPVRGPLCFLWFPLWFFVWPPWLCADRFQTRIDGSCNVHVYVFTADDMFWNGMRLSNYYFHQICVPLLNICFFQIFGFNAATSCNCHFFLLLQTPWILRGQDVSGELHHLESRAAVEVKQLNLWILIFWKLQAVKELESPSRTVAVTPFKLTTRIQYWKWWFGKGISLQMMAIL